MPDTKIMVGDALGCRVKGRLDYDRCPTAHGAFMVDLGRWIQGSEPATRVRTIWCHVCLKEYHQEIPFEDFCRLYPRQARGQNEA